MSELRHGPAILPVKPVSLLLFENARVPAVGPFYLDLLYGHSLLDSKAKNVVQAIKYPLCEKVDEGSNL